MIRSRVITHDVMTPERFLGIIQYSRNCPSRVHPARWAAMLNSYENRLDTLVYELLARGIIQTPSEVAPSKEGLGEYLDYLFGNREVLREHDELLEYIIEAR